MGDFAESKFNSNTPKDEAYLQSVIPRRISLFQSFQNQHDLQRIALSSEPIKITLRDGKVKEGNKGVTPYDVAKDISKSLASNALITKVDGVLWDMSRPLERDCKLELFDFDIDEGHALFGIQMPIFSACHWSRLTDVDCVFDHALQEERNNNLLSKLKFKGAGS